MSQKQLIEAIGQIDDEFIEEYSSYVAKKKAGVYIPWKMLAACASVILLIGSVLLLGRDSTVPTGDDNIVANIQTQGPFSTNVPEIKESQKPVSTENVPISTEENNDVDESKTWEIENVPNGDVILSTIQPVATEFYDIGNDDFVSANKDTLPSEKPFYQDSVFPTKRPDVDVENQPTKEPDNHSSDQKPGIEDGCIGSPEQATQPPTKEPWNPPEMGTSELPEIELSEPPDIIVSERPGIIVSERPDTVSSEQPDISISEEPGIPPVDIIPSEKPIYVDIRWNLVGTYIYPCDGLIADFENMLKTPEPSKEPSDIPTPPPSMSNPSPQPPEMSEAPAISENPVGPPTEITMPAVLPPESEAPGMLPTESEAPGMLPTESEAPGMLPTESEAPGMLPTESEAPEISAEPPGAEPPDWPIESAEPPGAEPPDWPIESAEPPGAEPPEDLTGAPVTPDEPASSEEPDTDDKNEPGTDKPVTPTLEKPVGKGWYWYSYNEKTGEEIVVAETKKEAENANSILRLKRMEDVIYLIQKKTSAKTLEEANSENPDPIFSSNIKESYIGELKLYLVESTNGAMYARFLMEDTLITIVNQGYGREYFLEMIQTMEKNE